MIKYKFLIGLLLIVSMASAQNFDQNKMNRDLEVARTVLNSLVNKSGVNWVSNDNKGRYIEGYGVILNMPPHNLIFGNFDFPVEDFDFHFDDFEDDFYDDFDDNVEVIIADGKRLEDMSAKEREEFQKEIEERAEEKAERAQERAERAQERAERSQELAQRQQELVARAQEIANKTVRVLRLDSMQIKSEEKRLAAMKTFLVDYAHLIGQLQPEEKILITDKSAHMVEFTNSFGVDALKNSRLSAEIAVKDVQALQSGKISREEALERIKINRNEKESKKVYKDLELFKSIIDRLYSRDLAETYYSYGNIEFEKLDGLGAMFFMNTVSSLKQSDGMWKVPTQDKGGLNQEARDELVKSLYPKFEQQLKENLVEYGRTVTSLNSDERIIFNAKITKCEGCGIPKNVELSIKASDLADFNSGKISKEQAISRIKVTQGEKQ
jgi:protein required for attachment to host cells